MQLIRHKFIEDLLIVSNKAGVVAAVGHLNPDQVDQINLYITRILIDKRALNSHCTFLKNHSSTFFNCLADPEKHSWPPGLANRILAHAIIDLTVEEKTDILLNPLATAFMHEMIWDTILGIKEHGPVAEIWDKLTDEVVRMEYPDPDEIQLQFTRIKQPLRAAASSTSINPTINFRMRSEAGYLVEIIGSEKKFTLKLLSVENLPWPPGTVEILIGEQIVYQGTLSQDKIIPLSETDVQPLLSSSCNLEIRTNPS